MAIYKLTPPLWLLTHNEDGGERLKLMKVDSWHEFDVLNWNQYNSEGVEVRASSQEFDDKKFIEKLLGIKPMERVEMFLNYQYKHTESKGLFLEHLGSGAIVNKLKDHREQQKILLEWVKIKLAALEKDNELGKLRGVTEENSEKNLADKLLVIRYLQKHSLFPSQESGKGDTATQFHIFLSFLLNEKPDTIKSSLARVDKTIRNKGITKENKTHWLRKLNNVLSHFRRINLTEPQPDIETLIKKIDNTSFE